MPSYTTGIFLALSSAAGFATLPIFIKMAYETGINTNTILTLRFALSAVLMLATLKIKGLSPVLPRRQAGILFLLGSLGFASTSLTFTESLRYLSASLTSILFHIYPALVAIISFLVGDERPSFITFLALVLCFIGLSLVVGISFTSIDFTGVILIVLSAFLYAIYAVSGNRIRSRINALIITLYICIASALVFGLTGIIQGNLDFQISFSGWLTLLGMALFATLVGILGFFTAMSRLGATKTCIISTTEPVITVFLALLLLGEHMNLWQIAGGILIASSIVLLQAFG